MQTTREYAYKIVSLLCPTDTILSKSDMADTLEEYLENQGLVCPFCGENSFDKIGLKHHFDMGHCESYNETMTPFDERIKSQGAV